VAGACIVDLDPGDPVVDREQTAADFEAIWQLYDEGYAGFVAKPQVDWDELRLRYGPGVREASTRFEASWGVSQMVAGLGDGHAIAQDLWRCSHCGFWGEPLSNVGACLSEVNGALFVNQVVPAHRSGFLPGDELIAIDGRGVESLLSDLNAQPRCHVGASTVAMHRARLVAGLMHRAETDHLATLRRDGVEISLELQPSEDFAEWLPCDGRVGPVSPRTHVFGVLSAELPGDVLYIFLPAFGVFDASGRFVTAPLIEELRGLFASAAQRRGVILDLRGNGGGAADVYLALSSWLYGEETLLFACQFKEGPGHLDLGPPRGMLAEPDATLHFDGPLAVLTNALSFSSSDFTAAFLQQTGRAKLFGASSGGGFGNAAQVRVDPAWRLTINDILCADATGRLLEGAPPEVDFPVSYLPEDLMAGHDAVIEAARAWLVGEH